MRAPLKIALTGMGGAAAMALLLLGVRVLADGLQSTDQVPRHLAYHGSLDKDGAPVDGIVELTFRLYDGAAPGDPTWTETLEVDVRAGRFSALLGSSSGDSVAALTGAVEAADDLYLEISVLDGGIPVTLGQRQRFLPMPASHWSSVATDLTVHTLNGLSEGGALLLNPDGGGPVRLGGGLDIGGSQLRFAPDAALGDGGIALLHGADDTLVVNPEGQLSGGTSITGSVMTSPALVLMKRFTIYQSTTVNTGISANDFHCMIGGVRFSSGAIDADGTCENIMTLNTWRDYGQIWQVDVDLCSDSDHEDHEVGIVCFRTSLSVIESWW